ncbi:MAG: hypothetical protein IPH16_13975 [Haliscomenobacter sp.]|nr:hypothetical protein [Haliscomenobacter sp.]
MLQDIDTLKIMISDLGRLSGLQAQLKPLLSQVEQKIAPFHSRSLQNGFAAVQWCIDQGLIQQGITFLQETLISLIVEKIIGLSEINNYVWRIAAKGALNGSDNPNKTIQEKKRYQPDVPDETVKEKYEKMHQWVKSYPGLSDEYKKLTGPDGFRNDINHCGFRENPLKAEDLKRELRDLFESIKSLKLYAPQPLQPPLC